MKKLFVLLFVLITLLSCSEPMPRTIEIRVEVSGNEPVHFKFDHTDIGYVATPYTFNRIVHQLSYMPALSYSIECYSITPCTIVVYEDDLILHTETGSFIYWRNY